MLTSEYQTLVSYFVNCAQAESLGWVCPHQCGIHRIHRYLLSEYQTLVSYFVTRAKVKYLCRLAHISVGIYRCCRLLSCARCVAMFACRLFRGVHIHVDLPQSPRQNEPMRN